jgi:acyl-CoA synthetase (AMP-forming)/AMP-acid ligase II
MFEARIEGENGNHEDRTWLGTGDLGFIHHGELFITGRAKDLIILRGRNIYPVDIERAAEAASPQLRPGCSAVFVADSEADEKLVLCVDLRNGHHDSDELNKIAAAVRREVMKSEGVHVGTVALFNARSVPKTTSGKVRRSTCRKLWVEGTLKPRLRDEGLAAQAHLSVVDPGPARASASSTQDVIHAAVCEVTRCDVDRNAPLADQVNLIRWNLSAWSP